MSVFFILIAFVCIMWMISTIKKEYSNLLLYIVYFALFLFEGFRDISVGTDTYNYVQIFKRIGSHNWGFVFEIGNVEWGYALYNKILYSIWSNDQAIIFFNSLIVLILFFRFVKKNSPDPWLSTFLFITLLYYINTYNTVRQYIAVAFVLSNIHLIREKKFLKYSVVILIASTFHSASFLFWFLYLCNFIKITKKKIIIVGVVGCTLFLNFEWLVGILIKYLPAKSYVWYLLTVVDTGNGRTFLIALAIFLFGICFYKQVNLKMEDGKIYYIAAILACVFYLFTMKFYLMIRVAEVFAVMFIVFIPYIIFSLENYKMRCVFQFLIVIICMLYYVVAVTMNLMQGTIPYRI